MFARRNARRSSCARRPGSGNRTDWRDTTGLEQQRKKSKGLPGRCTKMPFRFLALPRRILSLRDLLAAGLISVCMLCTTTPTQAQTAASAAAATAASTADASPERAGTIKLVNGRVSASSGGTDRTLAAGDAVYGTDHITTGAGSSASLVLRDGTTIVVGPASRLELRGFAFDTTSYQGNLAVMVLRGSMRMISGLIRKNNPDGVHVETPTAVIGIRGTDFIVDVDPAEETR